MRVLVVEGTLGAAAHAREALLTAGHEVATCHDQGSLFPCHGLGSGPGCPLERDGGVDVALLVRDTVDPEPTASEDGVRCALRHHVPLAVMGAVEALPYAPYAATISAGFDDVADAVERAKASPMAAHQGVARAALRAVLSAEGIDAPDATVTVRRDGPMLTIVLDPGCGLDQRVTETASVRVLGAVRQLDRTASVIDVTLAAPAFIR